MHQRLHRRRRAAGRPRHRRVGDVRAPPHARPADAADRQPLRRAAGQPEFRTDDRRRTALSQVGYDGLIDYDGIVLSVRRRFSSEYQFGASYTGSRARDNLLTGSVGSDVQQQQPSRDRLRAVEPVGAAHLRRQRRLIVAAVRHPRQRHRLTGGAARPSTRAASSTSTATASSISATRRSRATRSAPTSYADVDMRVEKQFRFGSQRISVLRRSVQPVQPRQRRERLERVRSELRHADDVPAGTRDAVRAALLLRRPVTIALPRSAGHAADRVIAEVGRRRRARSSTSRPRLIRIPTVNPPGEAYDDCARLIGERLVERCGFDVEYLRGRGAPEHTPATPARERRRHAGAGRHDAAPRAPERPLRRRARRRRMDRRSVRRRASRDGRIYGRGVVRHESRASRPRCSRPRRFAAPASS